MLATWGSVFHFSSLCSFNRVPAAHSLYIGGGPKRDNHEKQSGIHRSFSGSIVVSFPAPRSCVITFSMIRSIQGTSRYIKSPFRTTANVGSLCPRCVKYFLL